MFSSRLATCGQQRALTICQAAPAHGFALASVLRTVPKPAGGFGGRGAKREARGGEVLLYPYGFSVRCSLFRVSSMRVRGGVLCVIVGWCGWGRDGGGGSLLRYMLEHSLRSQSRVACHTAHDTHSTDTGTGEHPRSTRGPDPDPETTAERFFGNSMRQRATSAPDAREARLQKRKLRAKRSTIQGGLEIHNT
jgi:hypothetical protein